MTPCSAKQTTMSPLPTDESRSTSSGSSTSTSSQTTATTDPQTGQFVGVCLLEITFLLIDFFFLFGFEHCFLFSFVRTAIPFTQEPQRDKPANVQPYYLYGSKVEEKLFLKSCRSNVCKGKLVFLLFQLNGASPLLYLFSASEHCLLPHIQLLQKLCWPASLQDHLPSPRLPRHCCSDGGAA